MAPKEKADTQTFSFDEVACMIAAMNTAGVVLGAKHYGLMAKLDGTRTTSSFEHKFRAVKARGKELATELSDGTAVQATPKSKNKTSTSTGNQRGSTLNAFCNSCPLTDHDLTHREGR
jgi:3-oxoacyl-ACP reductase-like protein